MTQRNPSVGGSPGCSAALAWLYRLPSRGLPRRVLVAVFGAGAVVAAHAQALPPGVRIGMPADQLSQASPGLTRLEHPKRLPGGLLGLWRGDAVDVAGQRFEPVLFVAEGQLRRVEYAAVTTTADDRGAAAFDALLAWGRSAWGAERLARDTGSLQASEIASWTVGDDLDVYLQRAESPRQASVRLVYKLRQRKDASEL